MIGSVRNLFWPLKLRGLSAQCGGGIQCTEFWVSYITHMLVVVGYSVHKMPNLHSRRSAYLLFLIVAVLVGFLFL